MTIQELLQSDPSQPLVNQGQARIADKLALVRTVQFVEPMQHELQEVYSGFPKAAKRPAFGCVVSR